MFCGRILFAAFRPLVARELRPMQQQLPVSSPLWCRGQLCGRVAGSAFWHLYMRRLSASMRELAAIQHRLLRASECVR